ncbi:MAG: biliverdin-producing heme oxygenase [Methylotenera sp. 24-45-7]|jgi:pyrroloquinoline quinone (PQQ) biosynthesis protein C|nr:MAG: biliverdin-producing heme oxygenase [Methylotenera sp. 24-45-7]OZA08456.1 MAG: biliverdin-producing heme oxygenase [Methylotenera sp. 17-45-7]OZA53642.1 MAG: biliverdin-producing heme oxygenase [Methylophilales bacterium 39-45-7]HQS37961.1 iron-containing redox enzyme family protein [Methylotenera sp.]HQS42981.1 iron-containing redox enzyme family protein [Methylotenera sp.]
MTFYETLLKETEKERNELMALPLIQQGAAGNISLQTYIGFLTQAYHHVKHTTPLLMACGSRLPGHYEWLRTAIGEYIEEEMGHQEWVLNDIEACGADKEAVRASKTLNSSASLATEVMVAYAYDMIQRVNPIGFFGMVLVLEGTSTAVATQAGETMMHSLNLPKKAFSYLLSHGSLDISHVSFYESLVNQISNADDQACLIHSAKIFYKLYGDIFRTIEAQYMH